jgi:hypothetical protein
LIFFPPPSFLFFLSPSHCFLFACGGLPVTSLFLSTGMLACVLSLTGVTYDGCCNVLLYCA